MHGSDIRALDVILEPANLLLEFVKGDRFDLDEGGDLGPPDTVTDGDKRGATSNETCLFDGTDSLFEGLRVSFIVSRFHLQGHDRLCVSSQNGRPRRDVKADIL